MKLTTWPHIAFAVVAIYSGSSVASAAAIQYNITFTNTGGFVNPAGSFIYDSSLAVNPFSSFVTSDRGLTFDLTLEANLYMGNSNVGACKSATSPAGLFNAFTTAGCQNQWQVNPALPSTTAFSFRVCATTSFCDDGTSAVVVSGTLPLNFGLFTAQASSIPEPGTACLAGLGALAWLATNRVRTQRRGQ
jgi:hypothetical protein